MKYIEQIRLDNVLRLADSYPTLSDFAQRIERSPTQVSRFMGKNPTKKIGGQLARDIEEKLHMPSGYLDHIHDPEPANMNIGTRIRELRKERQLTINQLAAAASTDVGNLSRLERNEQGFSQGMLIRVATALNVPVAELFTGASAVSTENSIAERVISARKKQGLTQAELASMVGIKEPSVTQWETGKTSLSGNSLLKVAKALKVTPDFILYGEHSPQSESEGQHKRERIRQRREELKLTQQQLAEAAGVSYQAVQQWESGASSPRGHRLDALATALQCSKVWLEFGEATAVGEQIRGLMLERDWSEGELSRHSGVNQPTIHRIITGASKEPRASNLDKIAKALGVAPEYLRDQGGWYHEEQAVTKGSPVLSWNVVGTEFQEEPVSAKDVQHYLCPVPCSTSTFVLQLQAISMEPLFRDGDLIFIDPGADVRHGSYVVARLDDENEATFKQLIIEGGQKYLKPVNPNWPEQIIPINGNCTIVGPVVFSGRVF